MNKQEAIETIKNIGTLNIYDKVAGQQVDMVIKNQVIDLISQIDEQQKVVIPKFVAEWLDTLDGHGLFGLNYDVVDESVQNWVYENYDCNAKKLHLAYLYGYTVEQEKLYTVEIDGVSSGKLFKNIRTNEYLFHSGNGFNGYTDKLTETEIKQKDERLWQFAKEVEE